MTKYLQKREGCKSKNAPGAAAAAAGGAVSAAEVVEGAGGGARVIAFTGAVIPIMDTLSASAWKSLKDDRNSLTKEYESKVDRLNFLPNIRIINLLFINIRRKIITQLNFFLIPS